MFWFRFSSWSSWSTSANPANAAEPRRPPRTVARIRARRSLPSQGLQRALLAQDRPSASLRPRERERRMTRLDLAARVRNGGRRQHRNRGSGARFGAQRRRLRVGLDRARRELLQPHRTDVHDDYFRRRFVRHLIVT